VDVKGNVVALSGTVDSWRERVLCENVAKGVSGVVAVRNHIEVNYKDDRSDIEIENEIAQVLRWDVLVDHALIDVASEDGRVRLSGTVGSAAEKRRAEFDAHITGVKSVDSTELRVKRWARDRDLRERKHVVKSDAQILEAVKDALACDPRVFSFNVDPEVSEGVVTLRGEVSSLSARRAAEQDAGNTVGVVYVRNRLKVRPEERVSDQKIAERVRRALIRHPYVARYEISVTVENGIVNLYGEVDTYFEKSQAAEVTSRVKGVVAVDNYLVVDDYSPYYYSPHVDDFYPDRGWYPYDVRRVLKSDPELKEDIEDEFFWSPFVDADQVRVVVEDGIATLTGTVDSWPEYHAATENAYEGGARWVDNELAVKGD
jgi:osmotically-inducible protein OsmY